MNNYYNILAESLVKKHSAPLNEAWGNVPDWMKPRLTHLAHTKDRNQNAKTQRNQDFFMYRDWNTEYAKPRGGFRGQDLFTALGEEDFDLLNAQDIEGEPPRSTKDPRLVSPNIPIWHFPNRNMDNSQGQVYIKGVNDLEKLNASPDFDSKNYAGKPFGSLPLKTMADMCDHFAYIDGSTLTPQKQRDDKIRERRAYTSWEDNNAGLVRDMENAGKTFYGDSYDKSGYLVVPPAKKYADELRRRGLRKYAEKLSQLEQELNDCFDDIVESSYMSMQSRGIGNIRNDALSGAKNKLDYANDYYTSILNGIDGLVRNGYAEGSDDFLNRLDNYPTYFSSNLERAHNYIKQAQSELKQSGYSIIDF